MREAIKLDQNSMIGASNVFIIIPFSTDGISLVNFQHVDFAEWYKFGQNVDKECDYEKKLIEPTNTSLMRQFLDIDKDNYSENYLRLNPFTRGLICRVNYTNEMLTGVRVRILVTYHTDGIGTITLINSLPSMTLKRYFTVIRELKNWDTQTISGVEKTTMNEYLFCLFCSEHPQQSEKKRLSIISIGEEYPFFTLGGADVDIGPLKQFVSNNRALIYGLSHQDLDYGGWERVREENVNTLLDRDLSRRTDYGIYLTDVAMLEIDTEARLSFINHWAKKRDTTEENMRLKLHFERVQLLEYLLMQRFILRKMESEILQYDISSDTPVRELVKLKNKINTTLSDYYYANAMTRQHVSGIEWVTYGQNRFHLEKLANHIKDQIGLIESCQQLKNDFNNMRGNYIFQLISILLGSSAVVNIVDVLIQFPFFTGTWFENNLILIKIIVYALFLIWIVTLTIKYSKDR